MFWLFYYCFLLVICNPQLNVAGDDKINGNTLCLYTEKSGLINMFTVNIDFMR